MTRYTLHGVTSDGDTFDFPGVYFNTVEEATNYAVEYAHGVTGTDIVYANYDTGWVRAVGENYSESIRVR